MTSTAGEPTIVDRPDEGRFLVERDGSTGELIYEATGGCLYILHVGVPPAIERHGLGTALLRAAFERAEDEGLTVVPWCPFARRHLRQHLDEATRLTIDFDARPGDYL